MFIVNKMDVSRILRIGTRVRADSCSANVGVQGTCSGLSLLIALIRELKLVELQVMERKRLTASDGQESELK